MNRKLMSVVFVMATVCGIQAACADVTYTLADGFSPSVNTDTSTWSYRYQSNGSPDNQARDGAYELLPDTDGAATWSNNAGYWALPSVTKSGGAINVHPGDTTLVAVSWLAPSAGTVDLSCRFTDMDGYFAATSGFRWAVQKNGETPMGAGTVANGLDNTTGWLSYSAMPVIAGDRINLIVDQDGTALPGTLQNDVTRMDATVTYVPEPCALVLVSSAVFSLLAYAWRKRR